MPTLNRHLHALFSTCSTNYRATFLLRVVAVHPASHVQLERCVSYPLCTEAVYDRVMARQGLVWELNLRQRAALPRRFCKRLTSNTPINGLFARLIDSPLFDVSGNRGYALARAVYVGHAELIDRLLARGADASVHNNVAILFAVRKKDAELVAKLLDSESYRLSGLPAQFRSSANRSEWLPDAEARVLIDEAMRVGAMDVVDYLASIGAFTSSYCRPRSPACRRDAKYGRASLVDVAE